MNRGMEHETMRRKVRLASTDFFCGVAFTPFKREEAEVMGQYYKLHKKIQAGADFVTTQVGYDARKLHELLVWLQKQERSIPAIATIYMLSYTTARVMNTNRIPGCVVTDKMLAQLKEESSNKDKDVRRSWTAQPGCMPLLKVWGSPAPASAVRTCRTRV